MSLLNKKWKDFSGRWTLVRGKPIYHSRDERLNLKHPYYCLQELFTPQTKYILINLKLKLEEMYLFGKMNIPIVGR